MSLFVRDEWCYWNAKGLSLLLVCHSECYVSKGFSLHLKNGNAKAQGARGNNEARFPEEFSLSSVFRFYAHFQTLLPLQPVSSDAQGRSLVSGFPPCAAERPLAGHERGAGSVQRGFLATARAG